MADTITTSGLITSFSNTPQAKDDLYTVAMLSGLSENGGSVTLDVMANDLGGKAKTLYSLDDGIENEGSAASADLLTKDVVGADNSSKWGALIEFTADGKVAYTMTDASKAHFQSLAAGEVGLDTFTYAIRLSNGALSSATVTMEIQGSNDGPVITGAKVTGAVTEDATTPTLTDSGTITFDDLDLTDTHTVSVAPAAGNTLGGTLTAVVSDSATGVGDGTVTWTYTLDNSATQNLDDGEKAYETFTIMIADGHGGTVSRDITIVAPAHTQTSLRFALRYRGVQHEPGSSLGW